MLVRGDSLDRAMSRYLVDRIEQHDRITVRTGTEVIGGDGRDRLETVAIEGPEGEQTLATDALFILIGAEPPIVVAARPRSAVPRVESAWGFRRWRRASRLDQARRLRGRRGRDGRILGPLLPRGARPRQQARLTRLPARADAPV
jgi:hypothetical protein